MQEQLNMIATNIKFQKKVIEEKQKIITHLKESHLAVLNADDQNVMSMRTLTKAKILTYGLAEGADFRATDIKLSHKGSEVGTSFKLNTQGKVLPVFLIVLFLS